METILGENFWHGYVKVDFLDPWDGANLESYMAIDFIELAVNKDSLGGFGVNPEDRRFEEIRIGDIDGFGWGDGAALTDHDPAVASANDNLVNLPNKLPVNRDGFGLLASGDFLPDIDADGAVEDSAEGDEPGDDWDRRSGEEVAGTYYTGSGFTQSGQIFFELGSQYTDMTLSRSYSYSAVEADPVLTGDLARVYGAYPAADGNSNVGSNLPGDGLNHPFYFNFYVEPFAIDPAKPLYLTMTHGDLDTALIEVEVRDIRANGATATLMAAGTTDDGAIESSFVVLDETTLEFADIFTWDAARNKWHGYLEVRFKNIDTATDEYFAIDFLELSTSQKNINLPGAGSTIRVPEDFDTIQAAINVALERSTILVAPGLYRENLDMLGKNIVLRSYNPLDPAVVATTIIDGDVDDDDTGDGAAITFRGTEDNTAAVRGFTIQNGKGSYGGGIAGYGTGATIEYNIIANNSAPYGGGLALCRGVVQANRISDNNAYVDETIDETSPFDGTGVGGGVYNCKNLMRNSILDNSAARAGGGVWDSGMLAGTQLVNNVIHHNSVSDGTLSEPPGVGVNISEHANKTLLAHNTIVDNIWDGEVINVIDESDSAQLLNNILWDSASPAPTAPNTDWDRLQGSDLRFNLIGGGPDKGIDPLWNMGDDPEFAVGANNYNLSMGSPAVDAGVEFIPPISLDHAGNPREASTPDIGALESPFHGQVQGYVTIDFPNVIVEGEPLVLNAHLSDSLQDLVTGGNLSWQWRRDEVDLDNGGSVSGATTASLTIDPVDLASAGDYTVVATIDSYDYLSGVSTLEVREFQTSIPDPGENLPASNRLTITPRHVSFGHVPQFTSAERVVRVFNTTNINQSGTATITEGPFEIAFGGSPRTFDLDPGEAATLILRAKPDTAGAFVGRLTFSTGEELTMSCHTVTNDQEGSHPSVAPDILQFGYVAPESSRDLSVLVTNTGSARLAGVAIATSPFAIVGSSGYSLAPTESTTLTIRFQPATAGDYEGHVAFTGGIGDEINVRGTSNSGSTAITSGIRINEIAPWNDYGLQLADSSFPDWIELYNENSEAVDLAGWTLTDDPSNTASYPALPAGTTIPGNGYLVVYATDNPAPPAGEFHTGFELDEINGGYLALRNLADTVVDSVEYPAASEMNRSYYLGVDDSEAKFSGKSTTLIWGWGAMTPGAPNGAANGKHKIYITPYIDNDIKHGFYFSESGLLVYDHDLVGYDRRLPDPRLSYIEFSGDPSQYLTPKEYLQVLKANSDYVFQNNTGELIRSQMLPIPLLYEEVVPKDHTVNAEVVWSQDEPIVVSGLPYKWHFGVDDPLHEEK